MRRHVQNLINLKVSDFYDADQKRMFRQVNAFNYSIGLISFSAIFIAWWFHLVPGVIIQSVAMCVYFSGLWLLRKDKVMLARNIAIYTFEIHIFAVSLFAVFATNHPVISYYSPVFIAYTLYPLIAALFDMSVLQHMLMAFLQMLAMQFSDAIRRLFNMEGIPDVSHDVLNIVVTVYTVLIASLIVYWLYNGNRVVKILEKERSQALEKLIDELKEQQKKIKQQKEDLQQLNAMKNKFFSIISHDLKSPFNAILGFSELLSEYEHDDESCRKYAKTLNLAAKNLYRLLENLLDWSRSQLDHIRFKPEDVDLFDTVGSAAGELMVQFSSKNILINNMVSPGTTVYADAELLGVILRNLLSNAAKYSMPGGKVTVESEDHPKYVTVAVNDSGTGINDKQLKKLFRIESKESMPGTGNETGTGLGLILTKEFVDKHKGRIWVKSTEGAGSSFYFTLPKQQD
ncbi:MAG: HAMP domain-containing histidine kinase [Bacteroidales bacterium]|nr:HAMP domain-containing histidine kinase [Bacteroidales bacterium]